eukprot:10994126-Alexandrium_andersonii.AAC.1
MGTAQPRNEETTGTTQPHHKQSTGAALPQCSHATATRRHKATTPQAECRRALAQRCHTTSRAQA